MPRDGGATRQRIMDAAQALILRQGYSATSVDRLIEAAGITKGTFFYHFPSKHALADALVRRWADADIQLLDDNLVRAMKLGREPVQQLLIFVGLFEEMFELPAEEQPGCLYASFCYEADLVDTEIAAVIRAALDTWRERLQPLMEAALQSRPPRLRVDAIELIDMFSVIIEGSFIVSRIYADAGMLATHLRHYRHYLELVFDVAEAAGRTDSAASG